MTDRDTLMPIMDACKELGITHHVAKRLIRENNIKLTPSPRDKRVMLVNVDTLRKALNA